MTALRAAVVGSGVAGIAMAHALRGIGVETRLFERTPRSRSTGYQLNVLGNGMYALARIGLLDALLDSGFGAPLRSAPIVDGPSGRVLRSFTPPGAGTPLASRSYYRGDLHRALLAGLEGEPPECERGVVSLREDPSRGCVELRLADGERAEFDLVVGADGAASTVRGLAFPEAPPYEPRYTALLFAVDVDPEGTSEAELLFRDQERRGHFVQLGAPGLALVLSAAGGGRFGVIVAPLASGLSEEPGDPERARELARALTREVCDPRVAHAIEHARWEEGNPLVWRVGDIAPLARYHAGRVALAGDAAHAMIPVVGQGANQSFEDAMVLARILDAERRAAPDAASAVAGALERYSAERAPHVAVIQREARRRVRGMTSRGPLSHRVGNFVLRRIPQRIFDRFDDHLLAYANADPECPIASRRRW